MKRRLLALLLCAGLLLSAAACSPKEGPQSSSSEHSTASQSAVENSPTPTPTPTPSPSPSPTPTPEESASFPEEEFQAAFERNPIDAQLDQDMNTAASTAAIQQAYNSAASRWQTVIGTAYGQAQQALSGEELSSLEEEQADWEANLDQNIQALQEENSQDALAAADAVVSYYRDRAQALCRVVYGATGQLPAFPEIGNGQAAG